MASPGSVRTSNPLPPDTAPAAVQRVHAFIEAVGMGSPLGSFVQACAAFRAGIVRIQEARDFHYFAGEANARMGLKVSALPVSTFGFAAAGRLVAIACEVFEDLRGQLQEASITRDTPLFLALPDPLDMRMAVAQELEDNESRRLEALGRRVLSITFENLNWPWPGGAWHCFGGGHVAFARALRAAGAWLAGGNGRGCVVAALDSVLDSQMLETLLMQHRLKTEDHPVGFTPGEAGMALLLRGAGRLSDGALQGRPLVKAVSLVEAPADAPCDGRALATCVRALLPWLAEGTGEPFWITDHNGEERRAMEWGALQVLLRAEAPRWEQFKAWYPAAGFGETGVASGAMGVCLAARALERKYASARAGIVLNTDEGGAHAAILLSSMPV